MSDDITVETTRVMWHSVGYRYEVGIDGDGMLSVRYFDQPGDKKPGQELTISLECAAKLAELIRLAAEAKS